MKKGIALLMLALFCLSAGCGSRGSNPEQIVPEMVGDDVTTVSVSHIVSGQVTEWELSGESVEAFRMWINGLEYKPERFEEGNTPGDMNGGEVYRFALAEGDHSEISYIINGPSDCYLLMEGNWYLVENPSNPPLMEEETEQSQNYDEGINLQQENDEWGLTLRAESVTAEGCTIVFVTQGGAPTGELMSGSWYRIEKKEGDGWTEVSYAPEIDGEIAWTAEGWIIPDEGSVSFEENWSFLYGELPQGTYRIVKEIMDWREAGDFDQKWYYAEFIL